MHRLAPILVVLVFNAEPARPRVGGQYQTPLAVGMVRNISDVASITLAWQNGSGYFYRHAT